MNRTPNAFLRAYIECALWSSTDQSTEQGGEPFDRNYDASDIADETYERMRTDCAAFEADNVDDLNEASDEIPMRDRAHHGHDFWLTRNGHGAGFWDRGYSDALGERLTAAAHAYGTFDLYFGDNGQIYGG